MGANDDKLVVNFANSVLREEVAALKAERDGYKAKLDKRAGDYLDCTQKWAVVTRWSAAWKAKAKELRSGDARHWRKERIDLINERNATVRDRDELRRLAAGMLALEDVREKVTGITSSDLVAALRAHLEGAGNGEG